MSTYVSNLESGHKGKTLEERDSIRCSGLNFGVAQWLERWIRRSKDPVILPVVLYGCETWILTLREEQKLRVFENKVLRKIFGAKWDEVTGEWRKLHNAELHVLYSSPDIIRNIKSRRLRWAGHVARIGESRNTYRVLDGRPEGRRPLGRPRWRWEDYIKMDLREVKYDGRTGLILLRIGRPMVGLCEGGNEPPGSLKPIIQDSIVQDAASAMHMDMPDVFRKLMSDGEEVINVTERPRWARTFRNRVHHF
ncbi:hypothetical protein ANN_25979 [Periplaneta americana]|uniref:Uncharacterized protein n=1 Tax=Periplaneta americana TaxID=6978 RepID=A0ABQ8S4N3_PERAM|nr:hypothetical protein ANN_25979 [Periplaneta americana]